MNVYLNRFEMSVTKADPLCTRSKQKVKDQEAGQD